MNEKTNLLHTHAVSRNNTLRLNVEILIKITSNSSIGLSRILATSRATFPCPSMTAASVLKSGSS